MKTFVTSWITYHALSMDELPAVAVSGCGVSALGEEDALQLLLTWVFAGRYLPENLVISVVRSQAELHQKHVLPNSGNMLRRGVWFP